MLRGMFTTLKMILHRFLVKTDRFCSWVMFITVHTNNTWLVVVTGCIVEVFSNISLFATPFGCCIIHCPPPVRNYM